MPASHELLVFSYLFRMSCYAIVFAHIFHCVRLQMDEPEFPLGAKDIDCV
jgi:hypothetical protein